ncbi:MAG: cation:proton antiporter [Actinomycetota bacterium]
MSEHQLFLILIDIVVIVAAARLGGELVLRAGIPQVVGELMAGICLGPSLLGWLWPGGFELLFPADELVRAPLELLGWVGVIFLVINAGLGTRLGVLRKEGRAVVTGWTGGFFLPFAMGFALGWLMPAGLRGDGISRVVFALFMATAISVSAIPVIARILLDLDLLKTRIGMVIMSTALADDTIGWIVLAAVIGLASSGAVDGTTMAVALGGTTLFLICAATAGQWAIRRGIRAVRALRIPHAQTTFIFLVVLAGGAITQLVHVHLVLGSFVGAVLVARSQGKQSQAIEAIQGVGTALFVPFFFGFSGLRVDLTTFDSSVVPVAALALVVACLSKLVGGAIGARMGGLSLWEAIAVGAGLNVRGAMELVIAAIGLSVGIVTLASYSIIVLIAVVTTLMAAPLMRYCVGRVQLESHIEAPVPVEVA